MKSHKGFTLLEVIIVCIVIGILAAIAIPNYFSLRNRAMEAATAENLHVANIVVELFATMAEGYYPLDLDVTVGQVLVATGLFNDPNINNRSICGGIGQRQCPPPWPPAALLCPHPDFSNKFNRANTTIIELPGGPPPIPPSGCLYYTIRNVDASGVFGTGYTLSAYGEKGPMPNVINGGHF